jgi:hypothetical protein
VLWRHLWESLKRLDGFESSGSPSNLWGNCGGSTWCVDDAIDSEDVDVILTSTG